MSQQLTRLLALALLTACLPAYSRAGQLLPPGFTSERLDAGPGTPLLRVVIPLQPAAAPQRDVRVPGASQSNMAVSEEAAAEQQSQPQAENSVRATGGVTRQLTALSAQQLQQETAQLQQAVHRPPEVRLDNDEAAVKRLESFAADLAVDTDNTGSNDDQLNINQQELQQDIDAHADVQSEGVAADWRADADSDMAAVDKPNPDSEDNPPAAPGERGSSPAMLSEAGRGSKDEVHVTVGGHRLSWRKESAGQDSEDVRRQLSRRVEQHAGGQTDTDTTSNRAQALPAEFPDALHQVHFQSYDDHGQTLDTASDTVSTGDATGTRQEPIPDAVHQMQLRHAPGLTRPAAQHPLSHRRAVAEGFGASPITTRFAQQLHTVGDESADVKPPNKVIVEAPKIPAIWVFVLTCLMAAASGLGATPFLFVGSLSKEWTALANAMACGVMLAASFDLVHEGQPYGANLVILGVVLGAAFIKASQEFLDQYEDVRFESLKGASARKTLLIVGIMGAHALGEGSGVGVSFCGNRGWAQGVLVTLAIGLHNIPEGLAVATVLVARGISARNAMLWAIATSLPQAVVALPAFLFVDAFQSFLPIALGFAAGCMIWMVFAELLPDALEDAKHSKVATAATMSAAWLEALRMMLATLEQPGGKLVSPVPDDMRALLPTIAILLPAALPAGAAGAALAYLSRPGPGLMGLAAGICAWMGLAGSVHAVLATRQIGAFQGLLLVSLGGVAALLLWRYNTAGAACAAGHALPKAEADVESQAAVPVVADSSSENVSGLPASQADSWDLLSQSSGSPPPSAGTPLGSTVPPSAALASLRPAALQRDSSLESKLASKGRAYVGAFGHAQGVSMRMALAGAAALAAQAVPEGWLMAQSAASSASDASLVLLPAAIMSALRGVVTACLAYPLVGHKSPRVAAVAMLVGSIAPITACVGVLREQAGPQDPAAALAAAVMVEKASAVAAGALLVFSLRLLAPAARQWHRRSAASGLVCGAAMAAVLYGLTSVLCWATPYCLDVHH